MEIHVCYKLQCITDKGPPNLNITMKTRAGGIPLNLTLILIWDTCTHLFLNIALYLWRITWFGECTNKSNNLYILCE